ncbi:MAG TPA: phytanoyl-CoA dioxygenase family protein [Abditibacteriaceae bacterium]|jgi:ectoine hydroxylase-related dioxygenase (phytanoyl-CoA dioxygenase family)
MTTPETLTQEQIDFYRANGFVHIPGIIAPEEVAIFHQAALEANQSTHNLSEGGHIFDQHVNVWRQSEGMKKLTLHPNIAAVATKLAGEPLRLWHDQILIKQPGKSRPTEFHQDQPYWPHADGPNPISCWIALCDVPVERGCMTFLPGSHRRTDLPMQNLGDARSLFTICPDLQWSPRMTVPLRAGDCTFHHGRCAHMATPNFTEEARVAHVVIFMPRTTTYNGVKHVVTDPLNLTKGALLEGELFPNVG